MISVFDLTALLLTLSALFSWINGRFIRLNHSVGLLVMGLAASLLLVLLELAFPDVQLYDQLTRTLEELDFTNIVMNGMLAFLLFAGAFIVDVDALRERAGAVAFLAFAGTLISTVIVGAGFWFAAQLIGQPLPLIWAMAFGALISPTDPIAVQSMLKNIHVPTSLRVQMQGEALFNDGIGIVLFTLIVAFATGTNSEDFGPGTVVELLFREAAGGLLLGAFTGYIAYRAMRAIDDFPVEVLITLAVVSGTYAVAQRLGVSGPLSMVAAALLINHRAPKDAMSERTERYVSALWTLIDEVLNSVLFLLIGLEVLVINAEALPLLLAAMAIPIVLVARLISVSAPFAVYRSNEKISTRNVPFLTWAGVRGGISVALALALPPAEAKPVILAATYAVVLFTIVVQGSTLGFVARRTLKLDGDRQQSET